MNAASQTSAANLQERLARLRQHLDCAWEERSRDDLEVLRRRAKRLETAEVVEDRHDATLELIQFALGQECYAFELVHIDRVIPWRPCLHLPSDCPHFAGMLDDRGEMLAVFDLHRYFLSDLKERPSAGFIVVIEHQKTRAGFCVDDLVGVTSLPGANLQPAPLNLLRRWQQLLLGVTDRGLIVLDASKLLEHADFIIK